MCCTPVKRYQPYCIASIMEPDIYAEYYERNIDANMSKPSDKKLMDLNDSNLYCPTSIKDTIQWFHFLTIMEHTAFASIEQTKAANAI